MADNLNTSDNDDISTVTPNFEGVVTGQRFVSTVATGTAPFTATSTTVCPNLNAAQLGGATFASPGAIGSTSPSTINATTIDATTYCGTTLTDNNVWSASSTSAAADALYAQNSSTTVDTYCSVRLYTRVGSVTSYVILDAHGRAAGSSDFVIRCRSSSVLGEKFRITHDGNMTNSGWTLTKKLVEASTAGSGAPNVLLAAETGTVLNNTGATAENYHTLPSAAAGLQFTFCVTDADGIRITAASGDTIRIAASVSAGAGFVRNATIGSVITLIALNTTEWFATSVVGTWTIDV